MTTQPTTEGAPAAGAWRRFGPLIGVAVAYLIGAWAVLRPLPVLGNSSLPLLPDSDPAQQAWFLALIHWSLATGHVSLLVHTIYAPTGFNLLDQGSFPLVGVLAAPLTGLLGALATYHLLLHLAYALSAFVAYLVLRRLGLCWVAAAVGGALYGFSPYSTHNYSYLFLVLVPLPPLMFLIVYQHLKGRQEEWRPGLRRGALLGLLAAAQFLISSEILASTFLVLASVLVVLGVAQLRQPAGLVTYLRALAPLAVGAAVVALILLAYPLWFALAGPGHYRGEAGVAGGRGIDWNTVFWPANDSLVAGHLPGAGVAGSPHTFADVALVGIPLLVVAAVAAWQGRRSGLVRALLVLTLVSWVWALGPRFMDGGARTSVPLPFALLEHQAVLRDIVPPRLTLYAIMGVAGLVAIGVDRWVPALRATPTRAAACLVVTLLGLVYIAPAAGVANDRISPSRAAVTEAALRVVPEGAVVLAYPFPRYPDDQAMLWQEQDGFRFDLVGGYAYQQNRDQVDLKSSAVVHLLDRAWTTGAVPSTLARAARAELPGILRRYGVTAIVVASTSQPLRGARAAAGFFRQACGRGMDRGPFVVWLVGGSGRC